MIDYSGWSLQRIFNKVSKHLLTQNKRALLYGRPAFSDDKYNRCAYGCLATIRDHSGPMSMNYYTFYLKGIVGTKYSLMEEMENCHDKLKPSRWPSRLRKIAKNFNLKIPDHLK